jgi:serine protease
MTCTTFGRARVDGLAGSVASAQDASFAEPGGNLTAAVNLNALAGQTLVQDRVGGSNTLDFYRFTLNTASRLDLRLDGLSADADLMLIRDQNDNGVFDVGETIATSSQLSSIPERIQTGLLAAGTYYVAVERPQATTTAYSLSLTADAAGESIATARDLGTLQGNQTYQDFVGDADPVDLYQIQIPASSNFRITIDGLSSDVDLYLIQDRNANGLIEKSELIAISELPSTNADQLQTNGLAAGTYILQVVQYTGNSNYTLSFSTGTATNDARLLGSLGADTFQVNLANPLTVVSGNGNVDFGQGLYDTLDLSAIASTSVQFNLAGLTSGSGVVHDPGNGARMFDAITLGDGNQIFFEGIEQIRFSDLTFTTGLSVTPNDPYFSQQWNLHMMGVHTAWRLTTGSSQVAIGIEDTGIGLNAQSAIHPDLRQPLYLGSSITGNAADDYFRTFRDDGYGPQNSSHGTAVQGIITAASNNGVGLSGINWNSPTIQVDVLDGNLGDLSLAEATRQLIARASQQNQRLIINMSLGGEGLDPAFEQLVAQNQANVLFVVAAGNDNAAQLSNPASLAARYSNVIAVGAAWGRTDTYGNSTTPGTRISYPGWWGSNYGTGLTLMAPSEVVTTEALRFGNRTSFTYDTQFNGTSAAAPNVAGVASLVWSANTSLSAGQVQQILAQTAFDLNTPGYDTRTGHGFVNADAAVRRAIALI